MKPISCPDCRALLTQSEPGLYACPRCCPDPFRVAGGRPARRPGAGRTFADTLTVRERSLRAVRQLEALAALLCSADSLAQNIAGELEDHRLGCGCVMCELGPWYILAELQKVVWAASVATTSVPHVDRDNRFPVVAEDEIVSPVGTFADSFRRIAALFEGWQPGWDRMARDGNAARGMAVAEPTAVVG